MYCKRIICIIKILYRSVECYYHFINLIYHSEWYGLNVTTTLKWPIIYTCIIKPIILSINIHIIERFVSCTISAQRDLLRFLNLVFQTRLYNQLHCNWLSFTEQAVGTRSEFRVAKIESCVVLNSNYRAC